MFASTIYPSIIVNAPYQTPDRVLDVLANALGKAGVRHVEALPDRLTFRPGFSFRADWNPFAWVTSGTLWLEPLPDRLVIRYRMKTVLQHEIAPFVGLPFFGILFFQSGPNLSGTFVTFLGLIMLAVYWVIPRVLILKWTMKILRDMDPRIVFKPAETP
jgi:hypothetical protein